MGACKKNVTEILIRHSKSIQVADHCLVGRAKGLKLLGQYQSKGMIKRLFKSIIKKPVKKLFKRVIKKSV